MIATTQNATPDRCGKVPPCQLGTVDRLGRLSLQLWALTATLYGEGLEDHDRYSDEIRDGVQWLVHDLASQVRDLVDQL